MMKLDAEELLARFEAAYGKMRGWDTLDLAPMTHEEQHRATELLNRISANCAHWHLQVRTVPRVGVGRVSIGGRTR